MAVRVGQRDENLILAHLLLHLPQHRLPLRLQTCLGKLAHMYHLKRLVFLGQGSYCSNPRVATLVAWVLL